MTAIHEEVYPCRSTRLRYQQRSLRKLISCTKPTSTSVRTAEWVFSRGHCREVSRTLKNPSFYNLCRCARRSVVSLFDVAPSAKRRRRRCDWRTIGVAICKTTYSQEMSTKRIGKRTCPGRSAGGGGLWMRLGMGGISFDNPFQIVFTQIYAGRYSSSSREGDILIQVARPGDRHNSGIAEGDKGTARVGPGAHLLGASAIGFTGVSARRSYFGDGRDRALGVVRRALGLGFRLHTTASSTCCYGVGYELGYM